MIHEEHTLWMGEKTRLFAQRWVPDGRPHAVLALVHGFGEHTGRYAHVGEALARQGYALCGVDLPGHGRTQGGRGRTSRAELVNAAQELLRDAKARFPDLPVFLYGHSMGGAIVLIAALTTALDAAGVIVTSPLIRLATQTPGWKVAAARLLAGLLPSFTIPNPLEMTELTRDPGMVAAVRGDPLYHTMVSARLGWDILQFMDVFEDQRGAFPVPLLVMQGTADRIVDAAATIALAGRLSGKITLKTWDGLYHELHNEPEKEAVMEYIVSWMRRISA